ncbi:MAG: hypothetical protein KAU20_06450 [Nanoarchaeota archaeon]|nr:hypothetical protein [Nanoarchaeota archaeon]
MPKKKGLIYIKRLLDKTEKAIFQIWYKKLMQHFVEGQVDSATEMLIQIACLDFIRVLRSLSFERNNPNWKPRYAAELTNSLRRTLKSLGITPEQTAMTNLNKSLSDIFAEIKTEVDKEESKKEDKTDA